MATAALFALATLVATWSGYPLVIRLIGGLRRPFAAPGDAALPTVSVIIASNGDREAIGARIDDVLAADYPADRLNVVVGLERTSGRARVADFTGGDGRLVVVEGDAPGGKACNLNAAVRIATGEILVFSDTAQRFDAGAIRALVADFANEAIAISSGMLEISAGRKKLNLAERYWRYERWLRHWESLVDSTVGVTGAIYAMRRSLWKPLPVGLILDDVHNPMRLVLEGWRVGFNRRAIAYDGRRFTAAEEYRRKVRTLTGVIQLCAWLPAVLNPLRNRIFVQFLFHKLLRLLTPYLTIVVGIGAAWEASRAILASPLGVKGLGAAVIVIALAALIPPVRRRIQSRLAWAYALQSSTFVATVNGVRGRWEVW